jgi:hypothetical protein
MLKLLKLTNAKDSRATAMVENPWDYRPEDEELHKGEFCNCLAMA